mmetsp:Transcript_34248/g.98625  ORF Transcript_34248/g.98625 Transcript_34248/m.98625 type:complete len:95 (-) Transcript_34248:475-759(-)
MHWLDLLGRPITAKLKIRVSVALHVTSHHITHTQYNIIPIATSHGELHAYSPRFDDIRATLSFLVKESITTHHSDHHTRHSDTHTRHSPLSASD